MKNVKNPHAPQICHQPPRFRSLLGNGASGKVGLSEKMYLNELILIQASPSMRLVPLFLFVFLTGARAMWEGETRGCFWKTWIKNCSICSGVRFLWNRFPTERNHQRSQVMLSLTIASDINRGLHICYLVKRMNCIKIKLPCYFFCKITYYCLNLDTNGLHVCYSVPY